MYAFIHFHPGWVSSTSHHTASPTLHIHIPKVRVKTKAQPIASTQKPVKILSMSISHQNFNPKTNTAVPTPYSFTDLIAKYPAVQAALQPIDSGKALQALQAADTQWHQLKTSGQLKPLPHDVITHHPTILDTQCDYDVVCAGGSGLGIFYALMLQSNGYSTCVIERGKLEGRLQEWNISREEMKVLVDMELLTQDEIEECVRSEFNPMRIAFCGSANVIQVNDVLNVGISPNKLIQICKNKFIQRGGTVLEYASFEKATIYKNAVQIHASSYSASSSNPSESQAAGGAAAFLSSSPTKESPKQSKSITSRLLVDAMGNFSPLVRQARKHNLKPDGVCVVVGTCADANWDPSLANSGDLIWSTTPIINQAQYFWEAFPASEGRTTYMFAYMDAHPQRPSLVEMFDTYLQLMPQYQNIQDANEVKYKRALFGFFPCYKDSPLKPQFDRLIHVGDSSGQQSPLSFGGFGAMLRHLPRLQQGLCLALKNDKYLARDKLALLSEYQPSLSVTWLFQRTMCVKVDQQISNAQIVNKVLDTNMQQMNRMGIDVLKPFLQDVITAPGLTKALLAMAFADPKLVLDVMKVVGIPGIASWYMHYMALLGYTALSAVGDTFLEPRSKTDFELNALLNTWRYGSGRDHLKHK